MAVRLSPRHVTWALVLLWVAAAAFTLPMALQGHADPSHYVPVAVLTIALVSWPFITGWRPFQAPQHRLVTCPECGAQWRPADEGLHACPACGAPTPRA